MNSFKSLLAHSCSFVSSFSWCSLYSLALFLKSPDRSCHSTPQRLCCRVHVRAVLPPSPPFFSFLFCYSAICISLIAFVPLPLFQGQNTRLPSSTASSPNSCPWFFLFPFKDMSPWIKKKKKIEVDIFHIRIFNQNSHMHHSLCLPAEIS